jgi:hypothetical protein
VEDHAQDVSAALVDGADAVAHLDPVVAAGATAAGRDRSEVEVWFTTRSSLDADRDKAIERIHASVSSILNHSMRFGLDGKRGLHEQLGLPVTKKRDSQLIHTRLLFAMRYLLTFPDSTKGWIPFAMKELERIQESTRVDAIVTTSPPISAHLIGRKAKQMFNAPWIADLRDLWSQNLAQGNDLVRLLERPVERRTLRDADALVSVSEPWAARLLALRSWSTAITVPDRSLNTSWLKTNTGRRPACSFPFVGSSSAHSTSPLNILAIERPPQRALPQPAPVPLPDEASHTPAPGACDLYGQSFPRPLAEWRGFCWGTRETSLTYRPVSEGIHLSR